MNCICKCCMQRVYCKGSAAYPCYLWQARRKKMPIWLLRNPPSSGKAIHLRGWACFSFLFIIILPSYTVYCLVLHPLPPPSYCSVFSQSLCSYLLYTLTLTLFCSSAVFFPTFSRFTSLSLVSSLWGSCGSERRFGARLRQYFTLIKRMVGSTVWAAQEQIFFFFQLVCRASFCCGGKEFISFIATLHHHQRQQFVVFALLLYIF